VIEKQGRERGRRERTRDSSTRFDDKFGSVTRYTGIHRGCVVLATRQRKTGGTTAECGERERAPKRFRF
jgi:hypothetical protein